MFGVIFFFFKAVYMPILNLKSITPISIASFKKKKFRQPRTVSNIGFAVSEILRYRQTTRETQILLLFYKDKVLKLNFLKKQPFLRHPVLKYGTKIGYIHNIYAMQLSYMSNWINIT